MFVTQYGGITLKQKSSLVYLAFYAFRNDYV